MTRPRLVTSRTSAVVPQGEVPRLDVLLSGFAISCLVPPDGRRHVASLLLPGDACDFEFLNGAASNTTVVAVTTCTFGTIRRQELEELSMGSPDLVQALWWESAVEHRSQVEWSASLGRRTAVERVCHMYLDAYRRLEAVGLAGDGRFSFPLTQDDVADRTGMTAVHVNRVLRSLRDEGVVQVVARGVVVRDLARLALKAHVMHLPSRYARPEPDWPLRHTSP